MAMFLGLAAPFWTWAQCSGWEAYPAGEQAAKEKHVIYSDLLRIKKYQEAFPIWEELFAHVKAPKEVKTKHFSDGIVLYYEFLRTEQDPAKILDYANKINELYEAKFKCFPENLDDRASQCYYLFYYANQPAKALETLERTYELGKTKVPYSVLYPYAWLTVESFKGKSPKYNAEKMRELYAMFQTIITERKAAKDPNLASFEGEWTKIQEKFKEIETQIFGCDYFVAKWEPLFAAAPNNHEQNALILDELRNKGRCNKDEPFFQKVEEAYAPHRAYLDSLRQDSLFKCCMSDYQRGAYLEKKGEKDKAYEYYQKALGDAELGREEKAQLSYRLAYSYFNKKDFTTARSYCYKANEYKPNWAEPHTLIGLMYASSGKLCGPGTGWDSQVVVWAAMDEWSKACAVEPDNCADARKYIAQYSAYLPTAEEGFQRSIAAGSAYKIGCWIGVTTTVRYK